LLKHSIVLLHVFKVYVKNLTCGTSNARFYIFVRVNFRTMSCFGGRMKEYERVSLDRFDGKNLQSTVYFLSHLHTGKSCPFLHQLEFNFCLVLVLVTRQPKLDFLCLICKCFSRDTRGILLQFSSIR